MQRAILIVLIILLLKIATYACEWKQIEPSFIKEFQAKAQLQCETLPALLTKKSSTVFCNDSKNYVVAYDKESVYTITQTVTRHNLLSQCWLEGYVNDKCEVLLKEKKCQMWDLNIQN
ncbi:MAG: hypothetical protein ACK41T_12395 [Pseudobdellovibrio sp.]